MKKHIFILTFVLSTQILFARYVGLYNSIDIQRECKSAYDVKTCYRAIKAIINDKSMRRSERYYDAYKISEKLCRTRSFIKEGKYACKLEKYYLKKYYKTRR